MLVFIEFYDVLLPPYQFFVLLRYFLIVFIMKIEHKGKYQPSWIHSTNVPTGL